MLNAFWIANYLLNLLHSVVRFNSVCRPFSYMKDWTKSRLVFLCTLVWIVSFFLTVLFIINDNLYWIGSNTICIVIPTLTISLYLFTIAYMKMMKV
ncbi:hypothetical protein PFISCL1PPCAC_4276, partial [Pristionchus fissidentatus]